MSKTLLNERCNKCGSKLKRGFYPPDSHTKITAFEYGRIQWYYCNDKSYVEKLISEKKAEEELEEV